MGDSFASLALGGPAAESANAPLMAGRHCAQSPEAHNRSLTANHPLAAQSVRSQGCLRSSSSLIVMRLMEPRRTRRGAHDAPPCTAPQGTMKWLLSLTRRSLRDGVVHHSADEAPERARRM